MIFTFLKHLYWSIIALQWCVCFCFITKWISYTYTYIFISPPSCVSLPPSLSHPSRWSQSTELISLCYAAAIFTFFKLQGKTNLIKNNFLESNLKSIDNSKCFYWTCSPQHLKFLIKKMDVSLRQTLKHLKFDSTISLLNFWTQCVMAHLFFILWQ